MRNLPLLFFGIFFTLAFSWAGIVLANYLTIGQLAPTSSQLIADPDYTGQGQAPMIPDPDATQFPQVMSGQALQGKLVYAQMGCIYCHSQQVRRQGFGSDYERGWGDRQTVARDYIRHDRVFLGTMRTGPDLMTVGSRIPTRDWHHQHLYYPPITSEGSLMPPFAFLYEIREIGPDGPSPSRITVPEVGAGGVPVPEAYRVPPGYELVPTPRAEALVAYLLALKLDYDLPEMQRTQM